MVIDKGPESRAPAGAGSAKSKRVRATLAAVIVVILVRDVLILMVFIPLLIELHDNSYFSTNTAVVQRASSLYLDRISDRLPSHRWFGGNIGTVRLYRLSLHTSKNKLETRKHRFPVSSHQ
jgi:hypothetical protein